MLVFRRPREERTDVGAGLAGLSKPDVDLALDPLIRRESDAIKPVTNAPEEIVNQKRERLRAILLGKRSSGASDEH